MRERRFQRERLYADFGPVQIIAAAALVFAATIALSLIIVGQANWRVAVMIAVLVVAIVVTARFRYR